MEKKRKNFFIFFFSISYKILPKKILVQSVNKFTCLHDVLIIKTFFCLKRVVKEEFWRRIFNPFLIMRRSCFSIENLSNFLFCDGTVFKFWSFLKNSMWRFRSQINLTHNYLWFLWKIYELFWNLSESILGREWRFFKTLFSFQIEILWSQFFRKKLENSCIIFWMRAIWRLEFC